MADISCEKHGGVRLITIHRPDKMNSLDFAANDALIDIWRAFDQDDDARVAVITGEGEQAFCAGADLKTYTCRLHNRLRPSSDASTPTDRVLGASPAT
jgi:enoyl-CoA hydratase/carnithine racemase